MIPLVERAAGHGGRPAVSAADGGATYERLLALSAAGARRLLAGRDDLDGARVAFLAPPGVAWVAASWSIWRAGGVAVPLATVHPEPELAATVEDCDPERLLATPELAPRLAAIAAGRSLALTPTDELLADAAPPPASRCRASRRAGRRSSSTPAAPPGGRRAW